MDAHHSPWHPKEKETYLMYLFLARVYKIIFIVVGGGYVRSMKIYANLFF
jgi:hypothetical protein